MAEPAPPGARADVIELITPAGRGWTPVVRLVLGGIGDRLDLGLDELDDLQLAVERLLAEAGPDGRVRISVELGETTVRTSVGPLREEVIAEALQGPPSRPGELNLRRVLQTVVDSFGVEQVEREGLFVRLEKRIRAAQ